MVYIDIIKNGRCFPSCFELAFIAFTLEQYWGSHYGLLFRFFFQKKKQVKMQMSMNLIFISAADGLLYDHSFFKHLKRFVGFYIVLSAAMFITLPFGNGLNFSHSILNWMFFLSMGKASFHFIYLTLTLVFILSALLRS